MIQLYETLVIFYSREHLGIQSVLSKNRTELLPVTMRLSVLCSSARVLLHTISACSFVVCKSVCEDVQWLTTINMSYFRLWSCRISDCTSLVFHDTVFHVSDWPEMACTNNSQCLARNSECFAGTCLCTPGYYYSITSLSCLDSKWTDIHAISVITTPTLTAILLTVSGQFY